MSDKPLPSAAEIALASEAWEECQRERLSKPFAQALADQRAEYERRLEEKEREVGRINSFIRLIKYGVGDRARPYSREELMGFADDCINKRPLPDDEYWGDQ